MWFSHSAALPDPLLAELVVTTTHLQTARREAARTSADAQPFIDIANKDQDDALAQIFEAETRLSEPNSLARKVRASIAQRKSVTSSKLAAPKIRLAEEARARLAVAQERFDALGLLRAGTAGSKHGV
jgi:hypothetical protein